FFWCAMACLVAAQERKQIWTEALHVPELTWTLDTLMIIALGFIGITFAQFASTSFAGARLISLEQREFDLARLRRNKRQLLYLRSFRDDPNSVVETNHGFSFSPNSWFERRPWFFEEVVASAVPDAAVLVALGRRDQYSHPIGSVRLEVKNANEWQKAVREEMAASFGVVFAMGTSAGLQWEFEEAISRGSVDVARIVIVNPCALQRDAASRWREFAEWFKRAARVNGWVLRLPDATETVTVVRFDKNGNGVAHLGGVNSPSTFRRGLTKLLREILTTPEQPNSEHFFQGHVDDRWSVHRVGSTGEVRELNKPG
ncbi:MAG TPA: hypothetical protein VIV60_24500, partial [Polyangiaceae bacterium]